MNKLWFTGLPVSVPLGALLAGIYGYVVGCYHHYEKSGLMDMQWDGITGFDILIMVLLILCTIIIVFLLNVKDYFLNQLHVSCFHLFFIFYN